jgi:REP element-mobilizing transposase RayT
MSHTSTNLLVHFIFSTKDRKPRITPDIESDLHAYLGGIIRELGGVALTINGTSDHVHLLVRLRANMSVADTARVSKTLRAGCMNAGLSIADSPGRRAREHSPSANRAQTRFETTFRINGSTMQRSRSKRSSWHFSEGTGLLLMSTTCGIDSYAPPGLAIDPDLPMACAVGSILLPLRG